MLRVLVYLRSAFVCSFDVNKTNHFTRHANPRVTINLLWVLYFSSIWEGNYFRWVVFINILIIVKFHYHFRLCKMSGGYTFICSKLQKSFVYIFYTFKIWTNLISCIFHNKYSCWLIYGCGTFKYFLQLPTFYNLRITLRVQPPAHRTFTTPAFTSWTNEQSSWHLNFKGSLHLNKQKVRWTLFFCSLWMEIIYCTLIRKMKKTKGHI